MALTNEQAAALAKLKQQTKGSFNRVKSKPPRVRRAGPPPGIKNGACRFSDFTFKLSDQGHPFFNLRFTILEPVEHLGRAFYIPHWINDSEWATSEQRFEECCSDIQLAGGDTEHCTREEDLIEELNRMKVTKPYCSFDTWEQKTGKRKGDTAVALQGPITPLTDADRCTRLDELGTSVQVEQAEAPRRQRPAGAPSGNGQAPVAQRPAAPATRPAAPVRPAPARPVAPAAPAARRPAAPAQPARRPAARPAPAPEPEPDIAASDEGYYDETTGEFIPYGDAPSDLGDPVADEALQVEEDNWLPEIDALYAWKSPEARSKKENYCTTAVDPDTRTCEAYRVRDNKAYTGIPVDELEVAVD